MAGLGGAFLGGSAGVGAIFHICVLRRPSAACNFKFTYFPTVKRLFRPPAEPSVPQSHGSKKGKHTAPKFAFIPPTSFGPTPGYIAAEMSASSVAGFCAARQPQGFDYADGHNKLVIRTCASSTS